MLTNADLCNAVHGMSLSAANGICLHSKRNERGAHKAIYCVRPKTLKQTALICLGRIIDPMLLELNLQLK